MASPFAAFRKYQKILIATLGLLAMIAFVVLPNIQQQREAGGGNADPVVVTSKYGNLTGRQLQSMKHRRQRLVRFLQSAVDAAAFDRLVSDQVKTEIERYFGNDGEESTVDLWLIVQRAKQLGMTICDDAINDFIISVVDDRVTNQQFDHLYKSQNLSEDEIFDSLQEELLARELLASFRTTLAATPPGRRWEYYQRLNRKVNIRLVAVSVADYVDQVEDPDEEVLKDFFEGHKGRLAHPNSSQPGFRVPKKASVEYIKADFTKYLDVAPVTDEEVEAYYMENRDQRFVKTELPGLGDGEVTEPKEPDGDSAKPQAAKGKYQPLDEVRDKIEKTLKRAKSIKAFEEIRKTSLQPIRDAVSKYSRRLKWYHAIGEEKGEKKPVKPDFAALAEEQNLTFHETVPLSPSEMSNLDIGQSRVEGRQSFLNYIFDSATVRRPRICLDQAGNVYLFWKTKSADERVPKFDDKGMRDKVLAVWKTVQARELAKAEAEKLAAEARKSEKSLGKTLGSRFDVQTSGPFSWWITTGLVGPQGQTILRRGSVEHVDRPGDDFMRRVYDLEVGQVGAAMNQPQTVAYVVQLEKTAPSDTVLWIGFKADSYGEYDSVGDSDQIRIRDSWIEGIRKDAKLDWKRKPIPPTKNR